MVPRGCLGHLSLALVPAGLVEKIAVSTLPWELLVADAHVLWQSTLLSVVVLFEKKILGRGEDDDWSANEDGDLDPVPQFCPFFGVRLVWVFRHDFLLVGNSGTDLGDGFRLHLRFGSQTRNGADRSASRLGCQGRRATGQARSKTSNKRLQNTRSKIK